MLVLAIFLSPPHPLGPTHLVQVPLVLLILQLPLQSVSFHRQLLQTVAQTEVDVEKQPAMW